MSTIRDFARAPVANPDGSRGIALHVIYRDPTPDGQLDVVKKSFNERYPPRAHRGVVHTMFCGPFGAAQMMGDNGGFGTSTAIQDVLSHELGHQLGLNHDGYQTHNSPIYPSLMSYSYQNITDGHVSHYSDGSLRSLLLNERKLTERLPVPLRSVHFLSNDPYYFPVQAAGSSTLVDWNRNGIFGEQGVLADINYSHFTDIGRRRYNVGSSESAPRWRLSAMDPPSDCCSSQAVRAAICPAPPPTPRPPPPASAPNVRVRSSSERGSVTTATATASGGLPRSWSRRTASSATRQPSPDPRRSGSLTPRRLGFARGGWRSGARQTRLRKSVRPCESSKATGRSPHFPRSATAWPSFCGAGRAGLSASAALAPTLAGLETGPELEAPIDSVAPVAAAAGPNRGGRPTVWVASISGPDPAIPGDCPPLRLRGRRPRGSSKSSEARRRLLRPRRLALPSAARARTRCHGANLPFRGRTVLSESLPGPGRRYPLGRTDGLDDRAQRPPVRLAPSQVLRTRRLRQPLSPRRLLVS